VAFWTRILVIAEVLSTSRNVVESECIRSINTSRSTGPGFRECGLTFPRTCMARELIGPPRMQRHWKIDPRKDRKGYLRDSQGREVGRDALGKEVEVEHDPREKTARLLKSCAICEKSDHSRHSFPARGDQLLNEFGNSFVDGRQIARTTACSWISRAGLFRNGISPGAICHISTAKEYVSRVALYRRLRKTCRVVQCNATTWPHKPVLSLKIHAGAKSTIGADSSWSNRIFAFKNACFLQFHIQSH
jgi:hypothetical protein